MAKVLFLKEFESLPSSSTKIIDTIISFIRDARNLDGGYGNWKGARSSMESSYQAINLLLSLNDFLNLTINEANQTLSFIQSLKTIEGGFYPLANWDVPDLTSTFRAIWLKQELKKSFPELQPKNDTDVLNYTLSNYNA